ncbi:hypothetical protein CQW23_00209 [Capsicum baccatum]|uniref:F-box domain-containing protein n=1 Tax=Capsicum baccatum TaxID=33114 RepID=A0A2G2XK31_CAPBA|nr:hypothetical protein CQW23_00209 [Capsicum baccatum]
MTIPILPVELISEILSRLPAKSVLQFKSVLKSWLALISSPEFAKAHLRFSVKNTEDIQHLLILGRFRLGIVRTDTRLAGSCNGLILLAHYSNSQYSILWNPTTGKRKTLPDYRPRWKSYASYGFGYDELHDDYKVVGIFYEYIIECSDDVEVKIYSLRSDCWTSVDYCGEILNNSCYSKELISPASGLFANGKLHWDASGPCLLNVCLSFDLANEKWEKLEKPSYGVGETDLCLGTLGSDFCVVSNYKKTHFSAWFYEGVRS